MKAWAEELQCFTVVLSNFQRAEFTAATRHHSRGILSLLFAPLLDASVSWRHGSRLYWPPRRKLVHIAENAKQPTIRAQV